MANEKRASMANAIRMLTVDAVEFTGSGHPGFPMGAADLVTALFAGPIRIDPAAPHWPDRDRFVLSANRGAMALYALYHLLGFEDYPIEALKSLRRLGSPTPGRPILGAGRGIEATTGPPGQGLAMAVGMALAERAMNAEFGDELVNHRTYTLASDDDLQEGVALEAIALAGELSLSRLIVLLAADNSRDTTGPALLQRVEAFGWHTVLVDGHDHDALAQTIDAAVRSDRPSLVAAQVVMGQGSPNRAGTPAVLDRPLGTAEAAATRGELGWAQGPFQLPEEARDAWRIAGLRAAHHHHEWRERWEACDTVKRAEFDRRCRGELPTEFAPAMAKLRADILREKQDTNTRAASTRVLGTINAEVPEMFGGSADLARFAGTKTDHQSMIASGFYGGRYVLYGAREHAMAAMMNGVALSRGLIPYGGSLLSFSDFARGAIRLSAMMRLRVIHVMIHDGISLGEAGATHQASEQLASLRSVPNLAVFRPADAVETVECWQIALERDNPSVLALSGRTVPALTLSDASTLPCRRGAYRVHEAAGEATATLFASGSEVSIAISAARILESLEIAAEVISVPCLELFAEEDPDYREAIIGDAPVKAAVEAAVRWGWDSIIGRDGLFFGLSGFGASAATDDLYAHFGITADAIVEGVRTRLGY